MSNDIFETQDGCRLSYTDEGTGVAVLWQHGLGATQQQPEEVFPATEGIRRITLECRGHGRSQLGDASALTIAQFADDAIALLDHLRIGKAVFGGISLGAAIALRLASLYPEKALGLILARPAWVVESAPARLKIYQDVAQLLFEYGPTEGALRFESSDLLQEVEQVSPDNAASLRSFFKRDRESTVQLLASIPGQGPGIFKSDIAALTCPTQVIANGQDFIHSIDTAEALAGLIPGSRLSVITSKTLSRERYVSEFQQVLRNFFMTVGKAA